MRIAWLLVCLGCASSTDARLDHVEPGMVTNLVATPAIVHGVDLFGAPRVDVDEEHASVDHTWTLSLGSTSIENVEWIDARQLAFEIPRGLAPGAYEVVAVSPRGERLVAARGVIVTDEPIGLALSIEDAPGGSGKAVGATLAAGDSLTAYAIARDNRGAFVANVAVNWSLTSSVGDITAGSATTTMFVAKRVGAASLVATRASAALSAESGELRVIAGAPATLAIEDAADGSGDPIGNVVGLTTDASKGLAAYAIARDAFGNFAAAPPVAWSLAGLAAALPAQPTSTVSVDFATPGNGVLSATASFATAQTGTLAVAAGQATQLAIQPSSVVTSADAAPTTFSAAGVDGDGNPTLDLGTLTWSIASGPITALSTSGTLDPVRAGSGTIAVASSHGASATSGTITIVPGNVATLAIAPPQLTTDADASPTTFVASGTDADGNPTTTLGTLVWSIASGPITSITGTGTFDPQVAGAGSIAVTSSLGPNATAPVTVAPGRAAALAITPSTVDRVEGEPAVAFVATATDADGNATPNTGAITWSIASGSFGALAPDGVLTPATPGTGNVRATSSHGATMTSGVVRVRARAALATSLSAPASAVITDVMTVQLAVTNTGESPATASPCVLDASGSGSVSIGAPSPATASIAPGETATFSWSVTATAAGTVQLASCATGTDTTTGASISGAQVAANIAIAPPVILTSSLAMPTWLGLGKSFAVTMQITNSGTASATGVSPSLLVSSGSGAATVTTSPTGGASIAAGATVSFTWTYTTSALGTLVFSGNATGTDSLTQGSVSSPVTSSNSADIVETMLVGADPFGDNTAFTYVVGYRNQVYLGPNKTGTKAARLRSDGAFELLSFAFARDTTGNQTANSAASLTSIGFAGCTPNTSACGPDNENGRGIFASGTIAGTEWLVLAGARTSGDLEYVYMTGDTDATLDFRYVDLSNHLGGNTRGTSAVHAFANRFYFGFPDSGGARPYFTQLSTMPGLSGLDASTTDALDLTADRFPGWQTTSVEIIDSFADLGSSLYAANDGGIMVSTTTAPRDYDHFPADWAVATPNAIAYTAKTSRTTTKHAELEPADRAFPQLAAFGGRLFAARNTTVGPQLWSCNPSLGSVASRCEPGDWILVAPNTTGDTQLTQFNNTSLTTISMVVATQDSLYVGYDSPTGVQVFRTTNPAAAARADFVGRLGCSAAQHPTTCAGIGGAGFGAATDTRIFDAKAITVNGTTAIWITTGDATTALALVAIP